LRVELKNSAEQNVDFVLFDELGAAAAATLSVSASSMISSSLRPSDHLGVMSSIVSSRRWRWPAHERHGPVSSAIMRP